MDLGGSHFDLVVLVAGLKLPVVCPGPLGTRLARGAAASADCPGKIFYLRTITFVGCGRPPRPCAAEHSFSCVLCNNKYNIVIPEIKLMPVWLTNVIICSRTSVFLFFLLVFVFEGEVVFFFLSVFPQ